MKAQTKETKTLLANLEKWRLGHDMCQKEFAKSIGITPAHYSKLLSGEIATINADSIYRIYDVTGMLCFQLMEVYTDDFLRLSKLCLGMTEKELKFMMQTAINLLDMRT